MDKKLNCMDPFLTTYRDHYILWELEKRKKWLDSLKVKNTEYREPIAESFKQYLCFEDPCINKSEENVESFCEKACDKYSGVKHFFDTPLNSDIIKLAKIYQGRSEYQVSYCDLVKEVEDKERRKKNAVVLPNDTKIALTTNLLSHRHPRMINSRVYSTMKLKPERPVNNLEPEPNIRKILKIETGNTEYSGKIGKLGNEIIVKQLHGEIPLL